MKSMADSFERAIAEYALRFFVSTGGDPRQGTVTVPGVLYTEGGSLTAGTASPSSAYGATTDAGSVTTKVSDLTMGIDASVLYGVVFGAVGVGAMALGEYSIDAWKERGMAADAKKISEDALTDRMTKTLAYQYRVYKNHEDTRAGQPFDDAELAYMKTLDGEMERYHQETLDLHDKFFPKPPPSGNELLAKSTTSILTTALYIAGGLVVGKVLLDTFLARKAAVPAAAAPSVTILETPAHKGV
jgi:hypothetical protein